MADKLKAVKGMPDILPENIAGWQYVEGCLREIMSRYAYTELRTPILEKTQLFKRSIGEVTDIVEKEMYTFDDQNGESITLRPEGTAGCVRSCVENSLLRNQQQQKLWYMGPMFRYERPQKGRYRQFHQLGVEAFNFAGPDVDAEQVAMIARLWKRLDLQDSISLEINSLGDSASREKYKQELVNYFTANKDKLDEDSQRRLVSNPLRILDSKNPDMQDLLDGAPVLTEFLDAESAEHFELFKQYLTELGIPFKINPRLVRGLDYYNRTVYEWVTDKLGSQSAVCAGGRFDSLVENLGGPAAPAVGFAIGLERILMLLEGKEYSPAFEVFFINAGSDADKSKGVSYAEQIRDKLSVVRMHMGAGSYKSQEKKAIKAGADIIVAQNDGVMTLKLPGAAPQELKVEQIIAQLEEFYNGRA